MFNKGKDILMSTLLGRSTGEKASIIRGIMGSGEDVPLLGEELLQARNALVTMSNRGTIGVTPISKLFGPGRLNAEDEFSGISNLESSLNPIPLLDINRSFVLSTNDTKGGSGTDINRQSLSNRTQSDEENTLRLPEQEIIRID